jgi:DUF3037 family protein
MAELKNCEYVLVEYAPSPLRETRVAVGLFLFEATGRLVRQGFAADWRQVRCLDPQADVEMLASLPMHFERMAGEERREQGGSQKQVLLSAQDDKRGVEHEGGGSFYERLMRMHEEGSGGLQVSAPRGVRTADPEREFDLLFEEYVAPPRAAREKQAPREGGRQWIHAQLCDALRRHALWERMAKDVPVAEFTAPGDGFRIDFSYRPNGVTKYLHAISLERDWNQAKLLSYTFWRIREKSQAAMTAIVADEGLVASNVTSSGVRAAAQSCREILAGAQIAMQPLAGIDAYLEGVGREMGAR